MDLLTSVEVEMYRGFRSDSKWESYMNKLTLEIEFQDNGESCHDNEQFVKLKSKWTLPDDEAGGGRKSKASSDWPIAKTLLDA